MEISKEIKAKIFAQYLENNASYGKIVSGNYIELLQCGLQRHDASLILIPLSSISDEDTEYVARLIETNISEEELKEYLASKQYLVNCLLSTDINEFELQMNPLTVLKIYQYLQSKGYALPYMEYSVEDLVEAGVYLY